MGFMHVLGEKDRPRGKSTMYTISIHPLGTIVYMSLLLSSDDTIHPSRRIVATHFEPTNCRSAFPCFDLPHFKATYRLTIITRELPTKAISNAEEEFSCSDKVGEM